MQKTKRLPEQTKGKTPWKLRIVPRLRGSWGWCCYSEKEIVMTKAAEKHGVARRVFIHEMMHKMMPWMDEEAVDHFSTDLDDALEMFEAVCPQA